MAKAKSVIDLLNEARARELAAITQYMTNHYELEDQGIGGLASKLKEIGIQEMKHAEKLAERILFLDGVPTSKPDLVAKKGLDIAGILKTGEALEAAACKMYNASAGACAQAKDQISKQVFEELLGDEEEHLDYFQTTAEHVEQLGAAYIATLIGE